MRSDRCGGRVRRDNRGAQLSDGAEAGDEAVEAVLVDVVVGDEGLLEAGQTGQPRAQVIDLMAASCQLAA